MIDGRGSLRESRWRFDAAQRRSVPARHRSVGERRPAPQTPLRAAVDEADRAPGGRGGGEPSGGAGHTLPIGPPAITPEPPGSPAEAGRAGEIAVVLLIEDDATNVLLTRRVLQLLPNLRVVVAGSGGLGIEMARDVAPQLILLDLHLPDMVGEEILAALRGDSRSRAIPAVVLSADDDPERLAGLRAAGAAGALTKPFDMHDLLRLVAGMLGRPHG